MHAYTVWHIYIVHLPLVVDDDWFYAPCIYKKVLFMSFAYD